MGVVLWSRYSFTEMTHLKPIKRSEFAFIRLRILVEDFFPVNKIHLHAPGRLAIVAIAMLFAAGNSILVYLFMLAVFLKFRWGQDVSDTTQVESSVDSVARGSPFQSPSESATLSTMMPARIHLPSAAKSPCPAPPQPSNGEWRLSQDFCEEDNMDCTVPEGTKLELGYRLVYTCSSAYTVNGDNVAYCGRNGKWSRVPECVENKCTALNSEARIAHCTRYRERVNCDSPLLPGTEAQVSCRPGYKEDRAFLRKRMNMVICKQDGEWHPHPLTCSPACGKAVTHQRPFVIGGSNATVGDFPWHVSLYMEDRSDTTIKDFICGATLIKANFLLTAAHCVYDDVLARTEDPKKLFYLTGNIFRDYDHPMHNSEIVRKGRVKNVFVPYTYIGLTGGYSSDIAILELEHPIAFSHILLPACLDNNDNAAPFLERGLYGRLAGFGRTATEETSSILQTIEVPYISYNDCKTSKYAVKNEVFITVDKFCAGYTNGSAVCEGDSGGGLVFKKNDLWYVMGVVSVGLGVDLDNGERTCQRFSYTLYTRVSVHIEWILDTISDAEQHHSQPHPTPNVRSSTVKYPARVPVHTATIPTHTAMSSPPPGKASFCPAPPQPANGQWKLHPSHCGNRVSCSISQGDELAPGNQLIYTCNRGYKMRGSSDVYCSSAGSWSAIPACIEVQCGSLSSASRTAACETQSGEWISCDHPVPVGTQAEVSCRAGYKGDATFRSLLGIVKCNSHGEWIPNPMSCSLICGRAITHQTPLVANGNLAKTGDFPWHASIHRQSTSGKEFLCGATLVTNNLLLTAAHCVYHESTRTTMDPKDLFVIMGNIFRDYDSPRHDPRIVRKGAVKNVYRNCQYYGTAGNYAGDIALLELGEPFQISEFLLPACLDVVGSSAQLLDTGSYGKIAGFGATQTGALSAILQTITVPYVTYNQCKSSQTNQSNDFLFSSDKFCAGYTNGTGLCVGDSGGGLVFKKNDLWYVLGIASIPLRASNEDASGSCDKYSYTLYTRVSNYQAWIAKVIFELERYKSYPSCDSEMA